MQHSTLTRETSLSCPCGEVYEGPARPGLTRFVRAHASHGVAVACPSCDGALQAAEAPSECPRCGLHLDWAE